MSNKELVDLKVETLRDEFYKFSVLMEALAIERDSRPAEPLSTSQSPNPYEMFIGYEENEVSTSFSSWFSLWGGVAGAGHSVEAWPNGIGWKPGKDRSGWPEWTHRYTDDQITLRPAGVDVALFGCTLPIRPPARMQVKERVRVRGYPAGVSVQDHYEVRNGFAYMERPEEFRDGAPATWIIVFDDGSQPAMGGMSGGPITLVRASGKEELCGVLITQNGRADLDFDGDKEHSSDIVELFDLYKILKVT